MSLLARAPVPSEKPYLLGPLSINQSWWHLSGHIGNLYQVTDCHISKNLLTFLTSDNNDPRGYILMVILANKTRLWKIEEENQRLLELRFWRA